jgi:phospholipid/cholesterol/gamma-HCH transport system substrate-binding protein
MHAMSTRSSVGRNLARVVAVACVFALLTATVVWWTMRRTGIKHVAANFASAVGVYVGSDVRVLGVRVGQITAVTPQGPTVRVEMDIDPGVHVPMDAQAVVVAPSVVSDRYVQLTPAYTGGAEMPDGKVIPREKTATPVELDQIYASVDKLVTALGPNGANKNGALTDLLNVGANNLNGNGTALGDTIRQLGDAAGTLSSSSNDLFGTIDQLQKFTSMLAADDSQVRTFNKQMADVNGFLASERTDLGAALSQLATALQSVQGFIKDNRTKLKSNVDHLAAITQVLVDQRAALAQVLDVAPLALDNLNNAYNAASGTLDVRANINELNNPPIVMVCKLLQQGKPTSVPPTLTDTCNKLAPVLNGVVKLPNPAQTINSLQQGQLPPLPLVDSLGLPGTPKAGGR